MEHVEPVSDKGAKTERAYENYGWFILTVSAIFGIVASVVTALPPLYVFSSPIFEDTYPIMGALGTALVGFNIFALVMILIPYRRSERWAWYTLWMLPLLWLSHFALRTDLIYLMLAVLTTVGLVLPYRRFFSSPEDSARV